MLDFQAQEHPVPLVSQGHTNPVMGQRLAIRVLLIHTVQLLLPHQFPLACRAQIIRLLQLERATSPTALATPGFIADRMSMFVVRQILMQA